MKNNYNPRSGKQNRSRQTIQENRSLNENKFEINESRRQPSNTQTLTVPSQFGASLALNAQSRSSRSTQPSNTKIDIQAQLSQQYGTRRPVSILKASKLLKNFRRIEMLEEGYLWDQDQPKVLIKDVQKSSLSVMKKEPPKKVNVISKMGKGKQGPKKRKRNVSMSDSNAESSDEEDKKETKAPEPQYMAVTDTLDNSQYELRNHHYFEPHEQNIDHIMEKVKQKVQPGASIQANIMRSISSFMSQMTKAKSETVTDIDKNVSNNIVQPGKKQAQWNDISASCACGDSVILGFGNGALICLNTRKEVQPQDTMHIETKFSGSEDKPVDKLKIVYIETFNNQGGDLTTQQQMTQQSQILLYSLSGGIINIHQYPSFERLDICDRDQVLDFEPYRNLGPKQDGMPKKYYNYYIAMLFQIQGNKVVQVFQYDTQYQNLIPKTKVPLHGPYGGGIEANKPTNFPVFDGGIAVYQDTFVIQYRDSAEFIKIVTSSSSRSKENEKIIRLMLPIFQNDQSMEHSFDERQMKKNKRISIEEHKIEKESILSNKNNQSDQFIPTPVFDEFLRAFIITRRDRSFYLDLNGNYDLEFKKIEWGNKVFKVQIANPYIIGHLQNSIIEVRNIFNPNRIFKRLDLLQSQQLISVCVSQNLQNRQNRGLEDFYVITKKSEFNHDPTQSVAAKDTFTLTKFKQDNGDNQIRLWHGLKQYSICLKFQDFLRDCNLRGGISSHDIYSLILSEKAFYNFIVKKRFWVTKDIVFRYLLPIPQVIALFSFIYHEGYFFQFKDLFGGSINKIKYLGQIQRIKIYHYPIDPNKKRIGINNQVDVQDQQDINIKNLPENEPMLLEMRTKIDYKIGQTILEFKNRKQKMLKKDPYYINQVLNPASQLTSDQLASLRIFLPFFIKQRLFLQKRYLLITNNPATPNPDVTSQDLKEEKDQTQYYSCYKDDEILKLLQYVEMIIFHSLILLMKSQEQEDKRDLALYQKQFQVLLEGDFSEEMYHQEIAKEAKSGSEDQVATTDKSEKQNPNIYLDPVCQQMKVKVQLPPFFCLDTFFKYRMYDEACQYLYYRREFTQLFQLIRFEYEENEQLCKELVAKIRQKQHLLNQGQQQQQQQQEESNNNSLNPMSVLQKEIERLKTQRELPRKLREEWKAKHVQYQQKINDIKPCQGGDEESEKAEKYCEKQSDWMFKVDEGMWVDCFKKSSNITEISEWNKKRKNQKQRKASSIPDDELKLTKPPFMSNTLLKAIQKKGNIRCSVRYLEYLTLKCNVSETSHHNELGCLYVIYITNLLKKYDLSKLKKEKENKEEEEKERRESKSKQGGDKEDQEGSSDSIEVKKVEPTNKNNNNQDQEDKEKDAAEAAEGQDNESNKSLGRLYDLEAARKDQSMIDLRGRLRDFMTTSKHYDPRRIYQFMKGKEQFLNKELAIIKMRLGWFKESFDICITDINDIDFAHKIAKKGFEWHNSDRRIYYNLFKKLVKTNDPDNIKQAKQVLAKNFKHIPYEKISKNFDDSEDLDKEMLNLYQNIFIQMESNNNAILLQKNLTDVECFHLKVEQFNYKANTSFEVNGIESECGVTMCSECNQPLIDGGKSIEDQPFQYDPVRGTMIHRFHISRYDEQREEDMPEQ